ncbi:MAG: TlpA family protein disulfide reductase, partial [Nitrospirae bacterium]|nr:TlpA family protein disulfide reductase [Nitrospirota bacterium]
RLKITYPILLDTSGDVFIKKYTVIGLPSTFIIDRNGVISERIIGRYDFTSKVFQEKIQRLLKR